jgi:hypothetical protein
LFNTESAFILFSSEGSGGVKFSYEEASHLLLTLSTLSSSGGRGRGFCPGATHSESQALEVTQDPGVHFPLVGDGGIAGPLPQKMILPFKFD